MYFRFINGDNSFDYRRNRINNRSNDDRDFEFAVTLSKKKFKRRS
jgi:hypothetical protein